MCALIPFPDYLSSLRAAIIDGPAATASFVDVSLGEARFGWSLIAPDLDRLPPTARILEIGAGPIMLSGYLASLGWDVTAVEPVAAGFDHMTEIQRRVLAALGDHRPKIVGVPVEELDAAEQYDYAFSLNVFEHIADVGRGLRNALRALKPGGRLRVYANNYAFPYEPHFNLPTFGSKRLTGMLLGRAIRNSTRMSHPAEIWAGLNWITWRHVCRICQGLGVTPISNRFATQAALERVLGDAEFQKRRSRWMVIAVRGLRRARLFSLARHVPPTLAPSLDFWIEKPR